MDTQANWSAVGFTGASFSIPFVQGERMKDIKSCLDELVNILIEMKEVYPNAFVTDNLEQFISGKVYLYYTYQQYKKVKKALKLLKMDLDKIV